MTVPCRAGAVLLSLAGCSSGPQAVSAASSPSSVGCVDAAAFYVPPVAEAGPEDVSPLLPGSMDVFVSGLTPVASDAGTATAPDPANWGCYVDSDCSVFPNLPYCDGNRCSGSTKVVSCDAGALSVPVTPEVRHTFSGTNGTFVEACDEHGNLLDYACAETQYCNMGCISVNSGAVGVPAQAVDCGGTCHDGRCDAQCPQQADHVTLLSASADGRAIVRNDTGGRFYSCSLDAPLQTADCTTGFDCSTVHGGQTGVVASRGLTSVFCTGPTFGSIALALDGVATAAGCYACSYTCSILQVPVCGGL